jgi:CheY-like chemotaxis protein
MKALSDYKVERAEDGVTGLAKLISFKPDLVVLDVDLQVIDGFKLLEHIRANLDVPIIVLSSSHVRASDRIKASELGADYFLTKPFAIKELRQKTRQLIARYRGIEEWITQPASAAPVERDRSGESVDRGPQPSESRSAERHPSESRGPGLADRSEEDFHEETPPQRRASDRQARERRRTGNGYGRPGRYGRRKADRPPQPLPESNEAIFVSYSEFVKKVENKVKEAIDSDTWFSIVGCRLPQAEHDPGPGVRGLRDLIPSLVRNGDFVSVNNANDVVIMLDDADATGAKAFINRLQQRILDEFNLEPVIWVRNFPTFDTRIH